jgi:hypothetical protein
MKKATHSLSRIVRAALACIAHPPRRMSDAGSNSGIFRLRLKIPLLFAEMNLRQSVFRPFISKQAHE